MSHITEKPAVPVKTIEQPGIPRTNALNEKALSDQLLAAMSSDRISAGGNSRDLLHAVAGGGDRPDANIQSETPAELRNKRVVGELRSQLENKYKESNDPKVKSALEYFSQPNRERGNLTPLDEIASMYSLLENADEQVVTEHASRVTEFAFNQQLDNPEEYVSHGFDHTLNVLTHYREIIANNPQYIDTIAKKYDISQSEARFLADMVAVYHDFGYPAAGAKQLGKAVHALEGAVIAAREDFVGLLQNPSIHIRHDFRDAVLYHGADKVEATYERKVQTKQGEILMNRGQTIRLVTQLEENQADLEDVRVEVEDSDAKDRIMKLANERKLPINADNIRVREGSSGLGGRKVDLEQKGDAALGIEYKEVEVDQDPLLAMIRIADNMDMLAERFSPAQREPAFQEIYHHLGDKREPQCQAYYEIQGLAKQAQKDGQEAGTTSLPDRAAIEAKLKAVASLDPNEIKLFCDSFFAEQTSGKPKTFNDLEKAWKMHVAESILNQEKYRDMDVQTREKVLAMANKQTGESFRHFGGCEAVTGIQLVDGKIIVDVDAKKYDDLSQTYADEKSSNGSEIQVPVADYQIWRMWSALQCVKVQAGSEKGIPIFVRKIQDGNSEKPVVWLNPETR